MIMTADLAPFAGIVGGGFLIGLITGYAISIGCAPYRLGVKNAFGPPGAIYARNSFISFIPRRNSMIYLCKSSGSLLLAGKKLCGYLDLGISPSRLLLASLPGD